MKRLPRGATAERWLRGAVRRIATRARPEKIVLFGSRCRGMARPDSDFDLLVVTTRRGSSQATYDLVDEAIGEHLVPIDLLVCSRQDVEARLRIGDSFFEDVLRGGRVLYES